MVEDLLQVIERRFNELGLRFQIQRDHEPTPDAGVATVQISRRWMHETYLLQYARAMTFSKATRAALHNPSLPLLVASEYISEKSAAPLRNAGIQYIDASGNAYIEFEDVLIDVRGRPRRMIQSHPQQARRPSNMFSPRRAQVVFALISWPSLAYANVREVARTGGVSVGQAHDTLDMLDEAGYLPRSSSSLYRRRELLEYWAAAYPTGLSPRLAIASFRGDPEEFSKVNPEDAVFLSGESAVRDLIRPTTLTLYVKSLDPKLPILNRWRSDLQPNVFIRKKFWLSPEMNDGAPSGIRRAPWPLVYADLIASGDARQREVAREWRDRHVGPDEM
jgi:hypothetical protein